MKKLFKYIGYLAMSSFAVMSLYLVNLFLMKPYSIDHYLAKELTVSLLDSPEYMTYIGIFDPFNAILKHNQKLSIDTLKNINLQITGTYEDVYICNKSNDWLIKETVFRKRTSMYKSLSSGQCSNPRIARNLGGKKTI